MDRKRIESVVGATPAIVWHRSFHELYMSKTAMDMIGVEEEAKPGMQIEVERGHFYETGLGMRSIA